MGNPILYHGVIECGRRCIFVAEFCLGWRCQGALALQTGAPLRCPFALT